MIQIRDEFAKTDSTFTNIWRIKSAPDVIMIMCVCVCIASLVHHTHTKEQLPKILKQVRKSSLSLTCDPKHAYLEECSI